MSKKKFITVWYVMVIGCWLRLLSKAFVPERWTYHSA